MEAGEVSMTSGSILMGGALAVPGPHRRLLVCGRGTPMGDASLDVLGRSRPMGQPGASHGLIGALAGQ
jgi:hypothetical protein